jgi:hypothetical protein
LQSYDFFLDFANIFFDWHKKKRNPKVSFF